MNLQLRRSLSSHTCSIRLDAHQTRVSCLLIIVAVHSLFVHIMPMPPFQPSGALPPSTYDEVVSLSFHRFLFCFILIQRMRAQPLWTLGELETDI